MHEYNERKHQFSETHEKLNEMRQKLTGQDVDHNVYSDWYDEEI